MADKQDNPVSQETKNQMAAVKQLVNVYDLLNLASFQGTFSKRVLEAQSFIKALHADAFKSLENAPDYEQLISEGKEQPSEKV